MDPGCRRDQEDCEGGSSLHCRQCWSAYALTGNNRSSQLTHHSPRRDVTPLLQSSKRRNQSFMCWLTTRELPGVHHTTTSRKRRDGTMSSTSTSRVSSTVRPSVYDVFRITDYVLQWLLGMLLSHINLLPQLILLQAHGSPCQGLKQSWSCPCH